MNEVNNEWHEANELPDNPTIKQRIIWHQNHAEYCNCWLIPSKLLLEELQKEEV